jgi:hypothetical protein
MKTRLALWLSACCALAILGCSKGDTGPAGPAGPTNAIYSEWYSPETWRAEINFDVHYRAYNMAAPSLTQEIVDQGVVLVYMRFVGSNPAILQLPLAFGEYPGYSFSYEAQADSVKAKYYQPADPSSFPEVIQIWNQVRYVLIPGSEAAIAKAIDETSREHWRADLHAMSYADVCRKYDIPE